ncbi:hypothetical protein Ancab_012003 [Ancistrocladus abbreviatus]
MALPILFIILVASHLSPIFSAQSLKALVAPITKDGSSSLYSITVNHTDKFVIDLSSPFSWHHCPKGFAHVPCHSSQCSVAQSYHSPFCHPHNITGHKEANCKCSTTPVNPITKSCAISQLTSTSVSLPSTDGHNPMTTVKFESIYMSCAPRLLFRSLPRASSGMASLASAPLSLPLQFSTRVLKQFAICLPSTTTDQGVAFFGKGPFYLLPPPGIDVTNLLSFTPLLKNSSSLGYYINLRAISINGESVKFSKQMLEFDALGHGGVKLSTIVPYTTLKTPIYIAFLQQFARATRRIPRVKKVAPFDLCLNTSKLGSTRVGLPVPQIDLQLSNGKNWTIFGANSMKQVTDEVACLAFVDGGERAEQGVVIGSFQMENSFLLFDLVGWRFGFTATLFGVQTSCANFNFTAGI